MIEGILAIILQILPAIAPLLFKATERWLKAINAKEDRLKTFYAFRDEFNQSTAENGNDVLTGRDALKKLKEYVRNKGNK